MISTYIQIMRVNLSFSLSPSHTLTHTHIHMHTHTHTHIEIYASEDQCSYYVKLLVTASHFLSTVTISTFNVSFSFYFTLEIVSTLKSISDPSVDFRIRWQWHKTLPSLLKKEFPKHDTKLYVMLNLQIWNPEDRGAAYSSPLPQVDYNSKSSTC